jgi:phosphoglycerol transferase MdoB-like AlkP superfamily enzyme
MRTVYRWWAAIVFLAVVVQVGFAGYGAFYVAHKVDKGVVNESKFEDGFGLHSGFGYLVVLGGLVLLLLALAARTGKRRTLQSLGLFVLLIAQVLLAWIGFGVPAVGFFHPVNALAIFAFSGYLASTEWRMKDAALVAEPSTTGL